MGSITENLKLIYDNMERAAIKSGRSLDDITLIGVTKTVDVPRIKELLAQGVVNLGENRVQELLQKYDELSEKPVWHQIGQLQTNKVKYIIDKVSLIHSVDSEKLAEEIDKQAKRHNKVMDILVEINVANEASKAGISLSAASSFIEKISKLENIKVKGLMTVAPFVEKPEKNREEFIKMAKLFVDIQHKCINNIYMQFLSMGMTNDYEIAIEEGANIVRIGTGIFGQR